MAGQISISLEHEPNWFSDADLPEKQNKPLSPARPEVVCAGFVPFGSDSSTVRPGRGLSGWPAFGSRDAGRFDISVRLRILPTLSDPTRRISISTSIASDNHPARVLERGLPGMPTYEFIGEFVTIHIPVIRTNVKANYACAAPAANRQSFINAENQMLQFAPCWTDEELQAMGRLGLQRSDFVSLCAMKEKSRAAAPSGTSAVLNRPSFGATRLGVKLARPAMNALGQILNRPRLPDVGEILSNAFACQLASRPDRPDSLVKLIRLLAGEAARRGIQLLTLGFASDDPRLNAIFRHFSLTRISQSNLSRFGGRELEAAQENWMAGHW